MKLNCTLLTALLLCVAMPAFGYSCEDYCYDTFGDCQGDGRLVCPDSPFSWECPAEDLVEGEICYAGSGVGWDNCIGSCGSNSGMPSVDLNSPEWAPQIQFSTEVGGKIALASSGACVAWGWGGPFCSQVCDEGATCASANLSGYQNCRDKCNANCGPAALQACHDDCRYEYDWQVNYCEPCTCGGGGGAGSGDDDDDDVCIVSGGLGGTYCPPSCASCGMSL